MKPEIIAGTKLQIWQEIMRQTRYDEASKTPIPPDPLKAAADAEAIFNKLCANGAAKKRARGS